MKLCSTIAAGLIAGAVFAITPTMSLANDVVTASLAAPDVSGTYTWSMGGGGETTLVLKQEGDKLTGTLTGGRGGEAQIENGTVDGNKVKFTVTREWNDTKMVTEYNGTVDGDTIKLTVTTSREIEGKKKA